MSIFFKYHINFLLEHGTYYIGERQEKGARDITIIYSGGDDICVVGSWDEVIGFAIDLQESFERFAQGTLTISAGIGIYPKKYPISSMARETNELESYAKEYSNKNAIAFFDKDLGFSWKEFKDNILEEKLSFLKVFFKEVPEKGKAFLYRMLELMRNIEKDETAEKETDKINLARLAYLLGRLEESVKNTSQDRNISNFAKQIYQWINNPIEKKYLKTAIYIYVYLIREKEG